MTESEYYALWTAASKKSSEDPASLAILGGSLTNEAAFIFIAGYQAAIRATFPELCQQYESTSKKLGWLAYAASEDRNPENPKPGVSINNDKLSGFKTWIATSACVDQLVVKIGTGADAKYVLVEHPTPGLVITHKKNVRFLKLMSQGIAEFEAACFVPLTDLSLVKQFGWNEPYYIYLALLGSIQANLPDYKVIVDRLIGEVLTGCLTLPELDLEIQTLLIQLEQQDITLGSHWLHDKKLFSMYSAGIQG